MSRRLVRGLLLAGTIAVAFMVGRGFKERPAPYEDTFGGFITAEHFNAFAASLGCPLDVVDGERVEPAIRRLAACLHRND